MHVSILLFINTVFRHKKIIFFTVVRYQLKFKMLCTFFFSDGCHILHFINISWCTKITNDGLEAMSKGCHNLHTYIGKGLTQVWSTVFQLGFQKGRALLLKRALLSVNVGLKRALYFWIVFTIKLKRNNLLHELKKYMLKRALISLKYFRPLWVKLLKNNNNYIK